MRWLRRRRERRAAAERDRLSQHRTILRLRYMAALLEAGCPTDRLGEALEDFDRTIGVSLGITS